MNKERSFRSLAVIAVLVATIGLGVAFAALSQSLNIEGTVAVRGSSFRVQFANLQNPLITGNAEVVSPANLSITAMTFDILLHQPGDSVTYHFDVVNDGTIDAQVNEINLSGTNHPGITFSLTYVDGSPINIGDPLNAGAHRNLRLVVTYNFSLGEYSETDIELRLRASIGYVQR